MVMPSILIVAVAVTLIVAVVVLTYNKLVKLRNRVDNAWSQIDVQLQRRLDLISNLVETVKGYTAHEKETLEKLTIARANSINAHTARERMEAENQLTAGLGQLFSVVENYPELKSNTNFLALQSELSSTEDKVSYMRQSYNDTVMRFNNAIQSFPAVLIASTLGFEERSLFEAAQNASTAPRIKF